MVSGKIKLNYNYLRKKETSDAGKDYTISIGYQDIKQSLISRKKGRDFRKNIVLVLQHAC
jgi:hypothetical protein